MVHAFTTSAVRNASMWQQGDAAIPLHYMPNHPDFAGTSASASRVARAEKMTPDQAAAHAALQGKIFKLAAEMQRGEGEMLDRIKRGEKSL